MRSLLFTLFMLSWSVAQAEVYSCPAIYPKKDAKDSDLALTNARMHQGEMHGDGWLRGAGEVAEEGVDTRYGFGEGEQAWLVCSYGGNKRVKGRVHDGHEWGQYMDDGQREWWVRLAPRLVMCDLRVREIKSPGGRRGAWTAAVTCE